MKRSLWCIAIILMKELIRRCVGYNVDWRKLFFIGAILTIAGVVFQMFSLHYPLKMLFLSPHVTISSYESLNSTIPLSETLSKARAEEFQLVPAAPVVSVNSSIKLIQSMPVEPKRVTAPVKTKSISRRRKKNIKLDDKPKLLPPFPRKIVPSHLQVEVLRVLILFSFEAQQRKLLPINLPLWLAIFSEIHLVLVTK